MQIGGKSRRPMKPTQPQFVVQRANYTNEFALLGLDERGERTLEWVGDPNAATKFDSKFAAKVRVRDIEEVTETRVFKEIETKKGKK